MTICVKEICWRWRCPIACNWHISLYIVTNCQQVSVSSFPTQRSVCADVEGRHVGHARQIKRGASIVQLLTVRRNRKLTKGLGTA